MTMVRLTVNGRAVTEEVPPRLHLADFVRERLLLTGTHLGCEHGVCGACTLLLDDEPVRSCITFAAACDGAAVRTIEGLEGDLVAARLRAAFTAHHALQCGYCTPGMLVAARDIVRRLPDATDDAVRLELAGNLCRCTGYNGIVRAIRQVLDERLETGFMRCAPVATARFGGGAADAAPAAPPGLAPPGDGLRQRLRFDVPPDALWAAVRDPAAIVGCIPGATLTGVDGDVVTGEMALALGPVRVRFSGRATVTYDDAARSGAVQGGGSDIVGAKGSGGTRLSASAPFRVEADGAGSILALDIAFTLSGPLAPLAKGRVVALVADEIAAVFAATLQARLTGQAAPVARFGALRLLWRVVGAWVRRRSAKPVD